MSINLSNTTTPYQIPQLSLFSTNKNKNFSNSPDTADYRTYNKEVICPLSKLRLTAGFYSLYRHQAISIHAINQISSRQTLATHGTKIHTHTHARDDVFVILSHKMCLILLMTITFSIRFHTEKIKIISMSQSRREF